MKKKVIKQRCEKISLSKCEGGVCRTYKRVNKLRSKDRRDNTH